MKKKKKKSPPTEEEVGQLLDTVDAFAKQHGVDIAVFRAPDNSEEKARWVKNMWRLQVGMWVTNGAKCAHCGHVYSSVEDFERRNPRDGRFSKNDGFDKMFVCDLCWIEYEAKHGGKSNLREM